MGLIAYIYRQEDDRDAIDMVTVVNIDGPFDPAPHRPAVLLEDGPLRGTKRIVLATQKDDGSWHMERREGHVGPMMGGTYVATSDSRFREAAGFYGAVAFHDRFETPEQYASMSQ